MADANKSPFDRVANGYDPRQVATFAAEALGWKRDLAACRSDLRAAASALDHYESVIGTVEEAEREAAMIIERAEEQAAMILETARSPETFEVPSPDVWLTPEAEPDRPDPIEQIFEMIEETEPLVSESERTRAAANLWKRRGVLTPRA